jgi:rubrerythrin
MADELVTVQTYRFAPEAEAARMHLEGEGLTVFLADKEIVNMDWLLGVAVGNVKLQVPQSQAARARALLGEMEAKRQERAEGADDEGTGVCLACGAAIPEQESKCPACGWTYAAGDDATPGGLS